MICFKYHQMCWMIILSYNITDNINEYDPIIKQQFGLKYIMQFPSIDQHEVVELDY